MGREKPTDAYGYQRIPTTFDGGPPLAGGVGVTLPELVSQPGDHLQAGVGGYVYVYMSVYLYIHMYINI